MERAAYGNSNQAKIPPSNSFRPFERKRSRSTVAFKATSNHSTALAQVKRMSRIVHVYGRKIFSVALLFNALLTVVFAVGLLASYYTLFPSWTPYAPFIFDGNLFWILIAAAIFNIFPCVSIGKIHTGRLWFHHYVYGFIVIGVAIVGAALLLPGGLPRLVIIYTTDVDVNLTRFLIVGGVTLILDDLADVSKGLYSGLKFMKSKAQQYSKAFHTVQAAMGLVSLYFLGAICAYLIVHPPEITLANSILVGTLTITAITSFANIKREVWLKVDAENPDCMHD
jgi:hypothetical protein